jgi:hypothetical protein
MLKQLQKITSLVIFSFLLVNTGISASAQFLPPEGEGIYQFILPEEYPVQEYNSICIEGYGDRPANEGIQYTLPEGTYTVKYIDLSATYDVDCNVTDESSVIDSAEMTIEENSTTVITLDSDTFQTLVIDEPEPITTGTVTFILAERVSNVPIAACIIGSPSDFELNEKYESPTGRFTAYLYADDEIEGKDCSEIVVDPVDTIEFDIVEDTDLTIYITNSEEGYVFTQEEPTVPEPTPINEEEVEEETTDEPAPATVTPRTGTEESSNLPLTILIVSAIAALIPAGILIAKRNKSPEKEKPDSKS